MRVQALQAARTRPCTTDAEVELRTQSALLLVRARETRRERRMRSNGARPAIDAARCFEARDLGDRIWTREPVRRRKRRAGVVERLLFRYRGPAEGAPNDDAPERARLPSDLPRDNRTVFFISRERSDATNPTPLKVRSTFSGEQAYCAPSPTRRCL